MERMPQVYSQTFVPFSSPVTGWKSKEKKPRHFLDRGNADDSASAEGRGRGE